MTVHHLLSEENIVSQCPVCGKVHPPQFSSHHDGEFHYKEIVCSACGYKTQVRFRPGSGDDSFNKRLRNIDSVIEEE